MFEYHEYMRKFINSNEFDNVWYFFYLKKNRTEGFVLWWMEQCLDWLNKPIFVCNSLLQVWQTKLECGKMVSHCSLCFHCCLLISNKWFCFFPAFVTSPWAAWCQLLWLSASCYKLSESISVSLRVVLQMSLKYSVGWPTEWHLVAISL